MSFQPARSPSCYGKHINIHPQSPCQRCAVMAPCAARYNQREDVLLKILIWPRLTDAPDASAVVIPDPRNLVPELLEPMERMLAESCGLRPLRRATVHRWGFHAHKAVVEIREASHRRIVIAALEHPPGRIAQLPVARQGVHLAPILDAKRRKRTEHLLRETPTRDEIKQWQRACTVGTLATMSGIRIATQFLEQVTTLWNAENPA